MTDITTQAELNNMFAKAITDLRNDFAREIASLRADLAAIPLHIETEFDQLKLDVEKGIHTKLDNLVSMTGGVHNTLGKLKTGVTSHVTSELATLGTDIKSKMLLTETGIHTKLNTLLSASRSFFSRLFGK